MEHFDAVVIGSGQGGTPLSLEMAAQGWKTALVERRLAGGVCTNDGCTPTKTMIASARVAALASRGAEFGVSCGAVLTDLARVVERKNELVHRGRGAIEKRLARQSGLELIVGEASFTGTAGTKEGGVQEPGSGAMTGAPVHRLQVALRDGGLREIATPRIVIDTGMRPQVPDLPGLESVPFLDSTSILDLTTLPEHLLVLGGGYIALEFAHMFRRFGSRVTIVERGTQLMAREDSDIAACLAEILRQDGIELHLGTEAVSVRQQAQLQITLTVQGAPALQARRDGSSQDGEWTLQGTHLLVATGRVPNIEALQLDRAGVAQTAEGFVRVNERLETTVPGIWALGDITGGPAFSHMAYDDHRVLRANLLEGGTCSTAGRLAPYCVFTDPELGRVGLSEKGAREAGLEIEVGTLAAGKIARAFEMSETRGMLKAVVEKGSGRLLGAAALVVNGGEVISQLQLAMMGGLTASTLREAIFIHPVLAEGLHPLFRNLK